MPKKKSAIDPKRVENDREWLACQNLVEFAGQWIAIGNESILARNKSLNKVMDVIQKSKLEYIPLYIRVPTEAVIQ